MSKLAGILGLGGFGKKGGRFAGDDVAEQTKEERDAAVRSLQRLIVYVPREVHLHLLRVLKKTPERVSDPKPFSKTIDAAILFADVSGMAQYCGALICFYAQGTGRRNGSASFIFSCNSLRSWQASPHSTNGCRREGRAGSRRCHST